MKRQSQVIETIPSLVERLQQQQRQELAETGEVNNGNSNAVPEEMREGDAQYEDSEEVEYEDGKDDDDAFEVDSAWLFLDALLRPDRKPRGGFKHQVWADATWVRPCHKTLLPVPWRQPYHSLESFDKHHVHDHEDLTDGNTRPWVVWVEHRINKEKKKSDSPSRPFLRAVLAEWKHTDLIFSMPTPAAAAAAAAPTKKPPSPPSCPPASVSAVAASSVVGRRLRALSHALVRKTVFLQDKNHIGGDDTKKGNYDKKSPPPRQQQGSSSTVGVGRKRNKRCRELLSVVSALANLDHEHGGDEEDANSLSSPFRSLLKSLSSSLNESSAGRRINPHGRDGDDESAAAIAWGLIRAALGGEVEADSTPRNHADSTGEERREKPCPPPPPSSSALLWSHYVLPIHSAERSITTLVPQNRTGQLGSVIPPLGVCSRDLPMVKHPAADTTCPLPDQTATPIATTHASASAAAFAAAADVAKPPLYPPHTKNTDSSRHHHSGALGVFSATVKPVRTSNPLPPTCVVVIAPPA